MRVEEIGVIWTEPKVCRPLDTVTVLFEYKALKGQKISFQLLDADHKPYYETTVLSKEGQSSIEIKAGGKPGTHYVVARVHLSESETFTRYGSFRVEAHTTIETDDERIDELLKMLEEGLKLSVDIVRVNNKPITFIKVSDNTWDNLAYPAFPAPALRYFIQDLKSMFEVVYDHQWPDGRLPDHVFGDASSGWGGKRRIRSMMADLESGMISTLYKGWVAHGDDEWVKGLLPRMEAGMEFITSDPRMFDEKYRLVKRPHTMDEWDYQLGDGSCFINENSKFVVMQGDTSSMFEACGLLAKLYRAVGNPDRAVYWQDQQKYYYEKGNEVFWDGVKYRHHLHLDAVDHGTFNEDDQLAMSNSWAITRDFANHEKAISILREYFRRLKETGDRFPWWTLQPGYPDETTFKQGEYANGGLFPWVGGELCRGAFEHGMEETAFAMLLDFYTVVKRDHGAVFTWYDREGTSQICSPAQTNYDAWGMQPWTQAVVEGLAGTRSEGKLFESVVCCPRWSAGGVKKAFVTAHFPASESYFSYQYRADDHRLEIVYTGTGKTVSWRVLLPAGSAKEISVILDDQPVAFEIETVEKSLYVVFNTDIYGVRKISIVRNNL